METPNDLIVIRGADLSGLPAGIWETAEFIHDRLKLLDGRPEIEKIKFIATALYSERKHAQEK